MIQEHIRERPAFLRPRFADGGQAALGEAIRIDRRDSRKDDSAATVQTTTPIKHVVVIFQENISFDHYFGTYPYATNPAGETPFQAKDDTPHVNNLLSGGLLRRIRTVRSLSGWTRRCR